MSRRMVIVPDGWPCALSDAPPGFFVFQDRLSMKSEYRTDGIVDAYCESGEYFWGMTSSVEDRAKLIVQPVEVKWEEC